MLSLRLFVHRGQRHNGQRHRVFFHRKAAKLSRQISANCKMGPKSNSFFLIDVKYEVGECQTRVGNDH